MTTQIQGSYNLELKFNGDRTFLNFWDSIHGNDVCIELRDGKYFKYVHEFEDTESEDFEGDPFEQVEISFEDFIRLIEKSVLESLS